MNIDKPWLLYHCSKLVNHRVNLSFNYYYDILHIDFKWSNFPESYNLTRLYSREMVENYRGDLTECIFEDFKRQVRGDSDV